MDAPREPAVPPATAEGADLTCPRCASPLRPAHDGTVTFSTCPSCEGVWIDRIQLTRWLGPVTDLPDPASDSASQDLPDQPHALTCPVCTGVCMVNLPHPRKARLRVDRCPYCSGAWTDHHTLAALRALPPPAAPGHVALRPLPSVLEPVAPTVLEDPDAPVAGTDSVRRAAAALPVAFAVSAVARWLHPAGTLLWMYRVTMHEPGHALAAWLCGTAAIPTPVGYTAWWPGRSWPTLMLMVALEGAGVFVGVVRRLPVLAVVAAAALGTQLWCTFHLTATQQECFRIWGGCAGELVYPTVLVSLFYLRLPDRWRWSAARWIALAMGSYVFTGAYLLWRAATTDSDLIPWGGAWDMRGDMERLHEDLHWSEYRITHTYVNVGTVCAAIMVLHYLYGVGRAVREHRNPAPAGPR